MGLGRGAGWLLAVLTCAPACAKGDEDRYVVFRTSPGAVINHENTTGVSDQPLPIHFTDGTARVVVSRAGYLKQAILLDQSDISESGEYPAQGNLTLQPEHFWIPYTDWVGNHLVLTLSATVLASALLALSLVRRGKHKQKARILEKFEARRDLHDSLVLQVVGGYMLAEPLGSGGMATVYRGLPVADLDESKAVAVKVLGREILEEPEFRERFRREVNAYRKLSHPNIVQIYDWGELETGLIYITLELIQGETLRSRMVKQSLPPLQVYSVIESLASALDHAHGRGVIHRDLKPENLMLTQSGQLRVMDFGLARHEGAERLTQTGVIMGTPAYMAPEQLSGGEVDARLDQYAIGVITYELLCQQLPYSNQSGMGLFGEILSGRPIPIRQLAPNLSPQLESVLARMLSKEPAGRFASVAAAWEALKLHLPGSA